MVNTRAKGNKIQRRLMTELEDEGWLVDKVEKTGRFTKQKDLFGLFDLCCVRKHTMKLIQVTCNRPHKHTPYLSFAIQYGHNKLLIEQHVWYDRKGWKEFNYHWNKGMMIEDRRK